MDIDLTENKITFKLLIQTYNDLIELINKIETLKPSEEMELIDKISKIT